MENQSLLIVDDEKNIRLTLSQALEPLGMPVRTAMNGEDALKKMEDGETGILLLDLKMPGMDGMDVLERVRRQWPKIRVIIVTAHGTIDSAVDAMKLGAVDFIQKPFSPVEIRDLVRQVMERDALDEGGADDYRLLIQLAKRHISDRRFDEARQQITRAVSRDPGQPEAYNLLGALAEIRGDIPEAQKFYRAALDIDPTYKTAWTNLDRTTSWHRFGKIDLGPDQEPEPKEEKAPDEKQGE
ncbi:MAG: response regulator [Thermodesulfobacteriota bacterium]